MTKSTKLKNAKREFNKELNNFRELMDFSYKKYKNNIAYEYKENKEDKENVKYIKKTYSDTYKDVKALASYLLDKKDKFSKVAVIGSNSYEWVISYFGITCAGLVVAPMDKLLPEAEIESLIKRSSVKAIIFEKKYLEILKKIQKQSDNELQTLICTEKLEDEKDILYLYDLIKDGKDLINNNKSKYDSVKIDENKMYIMLFTSGTTSQAKIVMLSQKNICSNIYAYQDHFKMWPEDNLLSFLPIHHTFESSITIIYGFYNGVTIAFCDGLRHIAENLKEYEISIFVAVPLLIETMYKKINKGIEDQGKTKLIKKLIKISNFLLKFHIDIRRKIFKQIINNFGGKLRIMLYGAAAMDKETIVGFNNFGIDSIQGYGLTETSPVLCAESEDRHKVGSCGFPLDNVNLKVIDKDKSGVGEIVAKGPNIFLGYYNDEKKTKEAFTEDGFFKTGDYGYIDENGFVFITGRKKDIIVLRNGKNVYPQEIEMLINKIPYITESMVYARNNSKMDTLLVAKIVYDKDLIKEKFKDAKKDDYNKLIFEDIKKINKELPSFKHIKQIIVTDEPMSKTTTQKIKRYEEIEKVEKELKKSDK